MPLIRYGLGLSLWVMSILAIGISLSTVWGRSVRPVRMVSLKLPSNCDVSEGDVVYRSTVAGLRFLGEVVAIGDAELLLGIDPRFAEELVADSRVACRSTPLSAEDALEALFPPRVMNLVSERIATDWTSHAEEMAGIWQPILIEVLADFTSALGDELGKAIEDHQDEITSIFHHHLAEWSDRWPAIQNRLADVVRDELTPVVGRLLNDAVVDAPKVEIALRFAQGDQAGAYQLMLDWLVGYSKQLSQEDRMVLNAALLRSWQVVREDRSLQAEWARLQRNILQDRDARALFGRVYHEAVSSNPRWSTLLNERVLESPVVRQAFFSSVERFGPTVQAILSLCLADERGRTRPEIVHLARSLALNRRVRWLTVPGPDQERPELLVPSPEPKSRGDSIP